MELLILLIVIYCCVCWRINDGKQQKLNITTLENRIANKPNQQDKLEHSYLHRLNQKFRSRMRFYSYKPNLIGGVQEANINSLSMRMAIIYNYQIYYSMSQLQKRQEFKQVIEYNNGKDFIQTHIFDQQDQGTTSRLNLKTIFIKEKYDKYDEQQWTFSTRNLNQQYDKNNISIVYSIQLEAYDQQNMNDDYLDLQEDNNLIIFKNQHNQIKGQYHVQVNTNQKYNLQYLPFWEHDKLSNWNIQDYLEIVQKIISQKKIYKSIPRKVTKPFGYFVILSVQNFGDLEFMIRYSDKGIDNGIDRNQFFKERKDQMKGDICAERSMSALLYGLLYQEGKIMTSGDESATQYKKMFTMTPSRNYFIRGFLWDEGFHNLILSKYDLELTIKIQDDWFNTLFDNGWIPREQARGQESESFIPSEFLVQNVNEGNPPSFILSIKSLVSQYKQCKTQIQEYQNKQQYDQLTQQENPEYIQNCVKKVGLIYQHFESNINKIKRWLEWHQDNLQVSQGIYKWWKDPVKGFIGSGLDDYPRLDEDGNSESYSLDLQVWMIEFANVLSNVYDILDDQSNSQTYHDVYLGLKNNLDKYFYDSSDGLYKSKTQVSGFISTDYKFENVYGYVNLFPLFFGLIDDKKVESTLKFVYNQYTLWSDHGIRSLSRSDKYYMKNDEYWTGPIWININYLVLRGLYIHYIENNPLAHTIYTELRQNIIQSVCGSYNDTMYFWEQYNQDTGKGQKNHPFNGWTSLISLIIQENYE